MSDSEPLVRIDRARFFDTNKEPTAILPSLLPATTGTDHSLIEAVQTLHDLITCLPEKVNESLTKCQNPKDGLSQQQSAALYLYSLQWPKGETSFYDMFNEVLRSEHRTRIIPFNDYYKLYKSALDRLPPIDAHVYRGINGDISEEYKKGTIHIWYGASSCTDEINVTEAFLNPRAKRTLFNIHCRNGKSIVNHSHFPTEKEVILSPRTYIRVISQSNPAKKFSIVQCEEIDPVSDEEIRSSQSLASALTPTAEPKLYLMWIDWFVNISEEYHKLQKEFIKLFDENNFEAFEETGEIDESIRDKKNDSIILIVSGQLGRHFLPLVHDLPQVKAVIINCLDAESNKIWSKDYPKVVAVVNSSEILIDEVIKAKQTEKEKIRITTITRKGSESNPLIGIDKVPVVSLAEALEPLTDIVPDLRQYARKMDRGNGTLNSDEVTAIYLCTIEMRSYKQSLFFKLNEALLSENIYLIKPYALFLKLMLSALDKIPSYEGVVYYGRNDDLMEDYKLGQRGIWWTLTEASKIKEVAEAFATHGSGVATLVTIECKNAKDVNTHSSFPAESIHYLLPGFCYEVVRVVQNETNIRSIYLVEISTTQPSKAVVSKTCSLS